MNHLLDPNIFLRKDTHVYSLLDRSDITFTSVTTFVDQFFEKFDAEKIANKLVNTHHKYLGRTVESLLEDPVEKTQRLKVRYNKLIKTPRGL